MTRAILLALALLASAQYLGIQKDMSSGGGGFTGHVSGGTISSNVTWGPGTVYVDGDLLVAQGAKLTVAAGTTVEFTGHYFLEIRGQIDARGTSPSSRDITFTSTDKTAPSACSTPPCGWRGIRIRGDGTPSGGTYAYEVGIGSPTLDQYIENAVLEYGIKKGDTVSESTHGNYADAGGGCLWAFEQRKLHMNGNLFRYCMTNNAAAEFAGAVLLMYLYPRGAGASEVLFSDNAFEDNLATQNGGGIGVWHSGTTIGQCQDGTYGCGAVRFLHGHFYRNTANPTGGGYRGYESDTTLESVTWGTGADANSPDDYSYNSGVMGSLTVIP